MHVHVGVRGADRAIAVCDHLRGVLPPLLALSANSPFLDGQDTGLASVRTEIFTRTFPRCGVHEPFGDWAAYADFIDLLTRDRSIVEATQLWWSVRPHHSFGTVELRICDAQTRGDEAFALAQMITACIAQSALDYDEGRLGPPMRQREIEENLWRAIRHGLDGTQIDFARREVIETRAGARAAGRVGGPGGATRSTSTLDVPERQRRHADAAPARGRHAVRRRLPRGDRGDRLDLRALASQSREPFPSDFTR